MAGSHRIRILVFIGFLLAALALAGLAYAAYRTMDNLVGRLEQAANPDPYYQALQTVMRTATALDARVRNYTLNQRPEELISEVRLTDSLRIQIDSLRTFENANPRLDTIAGLLSARVVLMDSIVDVIRAQEGPSAFAAFYDRLKSANEFRRSNRQKSRSPKTDSTESPEPVREEKITTPGEKAAFDTLSAEAFAKKMTDLGFQLSQLRQQIEAAVLDSSRAAEKVQSFEEKIAQKNTKYSRNRLARWQESLRLATIDAASARADFEQLSRQANALTESEAPEKPAPKPTVNTQKRDTLIARNNSPGKSSEQPNFNRMLRQAEGMVVKDSLNRLAVNATFLRLTDRDMELTEEIIRLLDDLEETRQAAAENRVDYARGISKKTRQLAALFGVSTAIILSLLLGIIFRDLNRSRTLQNNLAAAKARAEQLAVAKEEFLANMSHEIRTPMNAIIGFADALGQEQLSHKAAHSQQAIARSADHLLALLNDILDLSKIEAGQLQLEQISFSPQQVCQDVVLLYEQQAKDKGLYLNLIFSPDIPKALVGDPLRLRQMLLNLVSNALKFTEKGGVTLYARASSSHEEAIRMRFDVRDTGPGIAEKAQERIFQAFEQAESSTSRQYGGTGLGLAITSRLVSLLDGEIKLDSKPGQGATFSLLLPYVVGLEADLTEKTTPSRRTTSFAGMRVLAADDDPYNRELLSMTLEQWEVEAELVDDGKKAVEAALANDYHTILLDLRMPKMGGMEAARQIRAAKPDAVIIALTATATAQDKATARELGIHAVLLKPYQPDALARVLQPFAPEGQAISPKPKKPKPVPKQEKESQYDPSKLERMANGNTGFIKKMLGLFVTSASEQIPLFEAGLAKKDWESVGNIAHKMAPSVRQLGHEDLYSKLKQIEKEAENPKADSSLSLQAKDGLAALKNMLKAVKQDLNNRAI